MTSSVFKFSEILRISVLYFERVYLELGVGLTKIHWQEHLFTGTSFLEYRYSYRLGIGGPNHKFYFGENTYVGGGINQTTGFLGFTGTDKNGVNYGFNYENDFIREDGFFGGLGDHGDRFRTTGVNLFYGDLNVRLNLATGDPGLRNADRKREIIEGDGRFGYVGAKANDYRLGSLTIGYGGFYSGFDSEQIRDFFQNKIAHQNGEKYAIFKVLNQDIHLNSFYQSTNNYSTW